MTLYLNGVSVASAATAGSPSGSSGFSAQLGKDSCSGCGSYLNGTLDDVRIYNRALSAAEIWSLYNGAL